MSVYRRHLPCDVDQLESGGDAQLSGPTLCLASSTPVRDGYMQSVPAAGPVRPTGVTFVASADPAGGRFYVCDPGAHTIHVLDQESRRFQVLQDRRLRIRGQASPDALESAVCRSVFRQRNAR